MNTRWIICVMAWFTALGAAGISDAMPERLWATDGTELLFSGTAGISRFVRVNPMDVVEVTWNFGNLGGYSFDINVDTSTPVINGTFEVESVYRGFAVGHSWDYKETINASDSFPRTVWLRMSSYDAIHVSITPHPSIPINSVVINVRHELPELERLNETISLVNNSLTGELQDLNASLSELNATIQTMIGEIAQNISKLRNETFSAWSDLQRLMDNKYDIVNTSFSEVRQNISRLEFMIEQDRQSLLGLWRTHLIDVENITNDIMILNFSIEMLNDTVNLHEWRDGQLNELIQSISIRLGDLDSYTRDNILLLNRTLSVVRVVLEDQIMTANESVSSRINDTILLVDRAQRDIMFNLNRDAERNEMTTSRANATDNSLRTMGQRVADLEAELTQARSELASERRSSNTTTDSLSKSVNGATTLGLVGVFGAAGAVGLSMIRRKDGGIPPPVDSAPASVTETDGPQLNARTNEGEIK